MVKKKVLKERTDKTFYLYRAEFEELLKDKISNYGNCKYDNYWSWSPESVKVFSKYNSREPLPYKEINKVIEDFFNIVVKNIYLTKDDAKIWISFK